MHDSLKRSTTAAPALRSRRERRARRQPAIVRHVVMPGLEVATADARPRETVTAFLRRTGWATRHRDYGWQFRKGLPTILEINGEAVLRKQWSRRRIAANDNVRFVSYPLGPGGGGANTTKEVAGLVALVAVSAFALWAGPAAAGVLGLGKIAAGLLTAGIGIGGSLLVHALVAPKMGATNAPSSTQDQIYSVSSRNNVSKLGQPLPVWYGRLKDTPDLAATPWAEFVGNDQYLNVLLSVTMGSLSYEALYLDDTVLWDPVNGISATFPAAQIAFYEPGAAVMLFPTNVDQSAEVSGQELPDGTGSTHFPLGGTTPGAPLGPFAANPPGTVAQAIAIDFVFPGGCYSINAGDPQQVAQVCEIRLVAQYAPINDAGALIGGFQTLFDVTRAYCSKSPIRDSIKVNVPPGRYTVQFFRGDGSLQSPIGTSAVIWAGLRAFLAGNNSFPDVSTVAIRLLASQSTQGAYMFGVLGTRKLPVWNGSGFVTQATRNPAWAFLDTVTSPQYGSTLPIDKVDFNAVVNHASGCDRRGDTFDYRFETAVAVPDALDKILQTSRATHYWLGDTVSIVRDEWRDVPTMMLTDREIVRDSMQVSFQMLGDEDPDAVVIEYVDEDTWLPAQVQYPPNSAIFTATNPETKRLDGVVQRAQAFRECAFMYLQSIYRRETVQIGCEYEGRAITRGSVLRIQSELPEDYGQAGAVVAVSGNALTLSPAPTWDAGPFFIRLRRPNGTYFGPVLVRQGAGADIANLDPSSLVAAESVQSTTLAAVLAREDGAADPSFEFGTATTESKLCMVLSGQPNGELFTLQLVVDDQRVHATDLGDPPALPSSQFPSNAGVPLIVGLNGLFTQGTAEPVLTASWFPAAGAEFYVADISFDSGVTWSQVYDGEANNFSAVVTLAALTLRVQAVTPGKLRGPYSTITLDAPTIVISDATVELQSLLAGLHYQVTELQDLLNDRINTIDQRVSATIANLAALGWLDKRELRSQLAATAGAALAQIDEIQTVAVDAQNAVATLSTSVTAQFGTLTATVKTNTTAIAALDGFAAAEYAVTLNVNGYATGFNLINGGPGISEFVVVADKFQIQLPSYNGGAPYAVFTTGVAAGAPAVGISGNLLLDGTLTTRMIEAGSITGVLIAADSINTNHLAINSVDINRLIAGAATAIYPASFGGGINFPPGASVTCNIQGSSVLVLLTVVAGAGAGNSTTFGLSVDGAAQTGWPTYYPAGGAWASSFSWIVTGLSAGSHTFTPTVTNTQVSGGVLTVIDLRR